MKIVRDYIEFDKPEGEKFEYYTVSLTATFTTKREAEMLAEEFERVKTELQKHLRPAK